MIFFPYGNSGKFIELINNGLKYDGGMDLTQYFIKFTQMKKNNSDGSLIVSIGLGRRLLGKTLYLL